MSKKTTKKTTKKKAVTKVEEATTTTEPAKDEAPTVVVELTPEKEEPKVREPGPRMKIEEDWHPVTVSDSSGGWLERFKLVTGWIVRYRNKSGRKMSGMVYIEDRGHEWEAEPHGQETDWQLISPTDGDDGNCTEAYPIFRGWFIGHGIGVKREFSSVIYEKTIR